jgi:hypothetical protein
MDRRREEHDEPSELDAVEAVSPGSFDSASAKKPGEVMCPNCGHPVEAGFKFCDWCGRPLESPSTPDEAKPEPSKPDEAPSETPAATIAPKPPAPSEPEAKKPEPVQPPSAPPILREPSDVSTTTEVTRPVPAPPPAEFKPSLPREPVKPPERPVPAPPPNIPPAAPRPAATPIRSSARVDVPPPSAAKAEARPAPIEPQAAARSALIIVLQLVGAFAAGAIVLAAVAVIVTLVSSGGVALLEVKGLPVFIAVTTSVAAFAFLRTARGGSWLLWAVAALGLLVLVAVGAYLYRPVYLHNAQVRLERALKVWSDRDATAVDDFRGDLVSWTGTVADYQRDVAAVVGRHITASEFRGVAAPALQSLQEATISMQTHATSAHNAKLRNALATLAGVYGDELTGLKLVSTGILTNDFNALSSGDDQYKLARKRAATVFTEKIRPLLERAGLDSDAFEQALAQ